MDEMVLGLITEVVKGAPAVGGLALALYVMARQNGRLISLIEKICLECKSEPCHGEKVDTDKVLDLLNDNVSQ